MTPFEQDWHDKFMSNKATLTTLQKLAVAGKLSQEAVAAWAQERQELYGM